MHYHCEIVIPPTHNIEEAITSILKPFDESERDSEDSSLHPFWDWWVIGGRWAGRKLMARYDKAKLDAFYDWLKSEHVTVAGLQCGKQELSPADQIPKVDAKWNEMFPSAEFLPCPIFAHSNDQYGKGLQSTLPQDICRLQEMPGGMECERVIFAKPSYESETKDHTGPLEAEFMLCESQWNGCNHMKVDWDGTFQSALAKYLDSIKNYREEFAAKITPKDDWLVVTVDYHS